MAEQVRVLGGVDADEQTTVLAHRHGHGVVDHQGEDTEHAYFAELPIGQQLPDPGHQVARQVAGGRWGHAGR